MNKTKPLTVKQQHQKDNENDEEFQKQYQEQVKYQESLFQQQEQLQQQEQIHQQYQVGQQDVLIESIKKNPFDLNSWMSYIRTLESQVESFFFLINFRMEQKRNYKMLMKVF